MKLVPTGILKVNPEPVTWRERVGYVLRRMARAIDHRAHVVMVVETTPELDADDVNECLRFGWRQAAKALADLAEEEAIDTKLRHVAPTLYREHRGDKTRPLL